MKDNRTSVKRSLLVSAIALTLTAALLIGTTFAWFTSTAQTSVSDIQAGKLEVQIVDANNANKKLDTLSWQKSAGAAPNEAVLWEPNVTYKTQPFKVKSAGNLALKYKLALSSPTGDSVLLNNIEFSIVDENNNVVSIDTFEGHLTNTENLSDTFVLQGHMKEEAKNDCQGKTLNNINITVTATQDTVENDSNGNQYDKNATYLTYPAGVTKVSFPESVEYSTWTGAPATAPATAAYVDNTGAVKYVADVTDAIQAGATTVYLKEDATVNLNMSSQTNRTPELTNDLTIYANGADFNNGEIALNSDANAQRTNSTNLTLKIYDAKNLKIWGNSPADGVTQTIILENCHNVGTSPLGDIGELIMLNGGNGTVNASVTNCSVEKTNQAIKLDCNGSLAVKNCTFTDGAVAIKVSYKGTGTRTDTIEDSVFTKCGCTKDMFNTTDKNDPSYSKDPATDWRFEYSSAYAYKGNSTDNVSVNLTTKGNKIVDTIGTTETKIGSLVNLTEN